MVIDLAHLKNNWKSTVQSILTTTFALTGTLMLSSVIKPKTAAILTAINGVAKVLLGAFQTDGVQMPAGSTMTQTSKTTVTSPDSKV